MGLVSARPEPTRTHPTFTPQMLWGVCPVPGTVRGPDGDRGMSTANTPPHDPAELCPPCLLAGQAPPQRVMRGEEKKCQKDWVQLSRARWPPPRPPAPTGVQSNKLSVPFRGHWGGGAVGCRVTPTTPCSPVAISLPLRKREKRVPLSFLVLLLTSSCSFWPLL